MRRFLATTARGICVGYIPSPPDPQALKAQRTCPRTLWLKIPRSPPPPPEGPALSSAVLDSPAPTVGQRPWRVECLCAHAYVRQSEFLKPASVAPRYSSSFLFFKVHRKIWLLYKIAGKENGSEMNTRKTVKKGWFQGEPYDPYIRHSSNPYSALPDTGRQRASENRTHGNSAYRATSRGCYRYANPSLQRDGNVRMYVRAYTHIMRIS